MTNQQVTDEAEFRPTIAYIDEVEDERDNFFTDAYQCGYFDNIHVIHPEGNINDMVATLLELHIDALITDFNLSETCPIGYNGEELVSAFLAARNDFPCFIRTSFDQLAFDASDDVNRVYSKNGKEDTDVGRYLFDRVIKQVYQYNKRFNDWRNELAELLAVSEDERSAAQLERILDLDSKVEASLGKDAAIPRHVKEKLFEKEVQLIKETELLIEDIKNKLGE